MKRLVTILSTFFLLFLFNGAVFGVWYPDPNVVSTNPADGASGVSTTTTITATFDLAMDSSSITQTGRVTVNTWPANNPISGVVSYDSTSQTVTFTPSVALSSNQTYVVSLNKNIQSTNNKKINGNTWWGNYVWSFTTAAGDTTSPTVISTDPANNAQSIGVSAVITATFSEPMNAATIVSPAAIFTVNNGAVAGTVTYDATTRTATFTPSANLSPNTTYSVKITTAAKDLAGNSMAADKTWSFKTVAGDTTPPTVSSTSPVNNATGVLTTAIITAKFSEAIDPATITSTTFGVSAGGVPVTGTVDYNAATFTATFTPTVLSYATTYTATITTGVKDLAGNAMAANKVWTFTTAAFTVTDGTQYCQTPPLVSTVSALKPNVLLVVDNSGSMNEFAYKSAGTGNGTTSRDTSYSDSTTYTGYFDPTKMYKYTSTSGGFFEIDTTATYDITNHTNVFYWGNFLNWLTMRRVDMVRKVLVGGKTTPRSAGQANYLLAEDNPDRDYYKQFNNVKYTVDNGTVKNEGTNTTYNLKVYVGTSLPQSGLLLGSYSDQMNFGIMFFNSGYRFEDNLNSQRDGGFVAVDLGSTGTNLITQVENTEPTTWTPLAETLYEAVRYFQATTSAYNGGTYSGKDPIQYACQKNFVLILSDGESTKDRNVPGGNWNSPGSKVTDSYGFNVKTYMDKIAANEGITSQWATDANSSEGTYYLEGVAYYAHTTDLRTSTVGKSDITGTQNLTIYSVFAFDDSSVGRELLQRAAKYGAFQNINGADASGIPVPDITSEWDKDNNGIPDTYFEAQQGQQLESALINAFNDILARVSSGTAASILSNSDNNGANLVQAVFYPKKIYGDDEVTWVGELQSLWYYIDPFLTTNTIREDTVQDYKLKLKDDYIADFYLDTGLNQTRVKLFADANGDGVKDNSAVPNKTVDPDDVKSLWKAGKLLWGRDLSTSPRTIYTNLSGTLVDFTTSLATDAGTAATMLTNLQAANSTEASKLISYVRGNEQGGYRSRTVSIGGNPGVWRLGDIISSTPKLLSNAKLNNYDAVAPSGYNDSSYAKFAGSTDYANREMVFVGANDGMLHAFKLGLLARSNVVGEVSVVTDTSDIGKEQWAFIPKNSLPYLRYLTDPLYCHLFYVDLTTSIADVAIGYTIDPETDAAKRITCNSAKYWQCRKQTQYQTNSTNLDLTSGKSSWRTVLVGGMGLGGASRNINYSGTNTNIVKTPVDGLGYSSYFALDVTTPASPHLLWEFSHPELGYTTAGPAFVRVGESGDKNGRWFVVLASGPTGPIDLASREFLGRSDQNLKIFILDAATGELVSRDASNNPGPIDTGITNAFAGNITGSAIDTDRTRFQSAGNYTDDVLYLGYVKKGSSGAWDKGGVLRISTGDSANTEASDYSPTGKWAFTKLIDDIGPVTSGIAKLIDPSTQKLWVYFGTGRFYYRNASGIDDPTNRQAVYGIMDPCYTTANDIDQACSTTVTTSQLRDQSSDDSTSWASAGTIVSSYKGWFITLLAADATAGFSAQRIITKPVAATNGMVTFTTFKPSSDVCGYGGSTTNIAVQYNTGGALVASQKSGVILTQLSTGAFVQRMVGTDFTGRGGRETTSDANSTGGSSGDSSAVFSNAGLTAVKRIMHIQEK